MQKFKYLILGSFVITLVFSCANPRKLQDLETENEELEAKNEACNEELDSAKKKLAKLNERVRHMEKQINNLREDTTVFGKRYRKVSRLNKDVNDMYEKLKSQYKELLQNTSSEKERVSRDLQLKKRELEQKEENLNRLAKELDEKEENIEELSEDLEDREARIKKLERMINRKDSLVNALKNKISKALLSFREDDKLSVEMKNGKVYVSLSEKLLFASGSIKVDPKGIEALGKLAEVLEKHEDIQVMIEGHTDDVPYKSDGCIKDNWDLSVLRATSIVRILTERNDVDPKRIIASGRSKFHPVATNESSTGRRKNRRTEIILTPDLEKLFKLLESE